MEETIARINQLTPDEYHRLVLCIIKPYMEGDHASNLRFNRCIECGFMDVEVKGEGIEWFYDCDGNGNYGCNSQLFETCTYKKHITLDGGRCYIAKSCENLCKMHSNMTLFDLIYDRVYIERPLTKLRDIGLDF